MTFELNGKNLGWISFILFCSMVPLSNYLVSNVGTVCIPNGPCLLPVGFGYDTASGVLAAGLAFVLRDLTHRYLGLTFSIYAICIGALLSWLFSPPALVIASVVAFLVAELIDTAVYTPLIKKGLIVAAVGSSLVGMAVDSFLFLQIAFGSQKYIVGQLIAKTYMIALAVIFLKLIESKLPKAE